MALSPMQRSLCNKLVNDYYSLVAPVKAAKRAIQDQISILDTTLRNLVYSPIAFLDAKIDEFTSDVLDILPTDDLQAIDELLSFIDQCPYLTGLLPITTMATTSNSIFDYLNDLADDFNSLVPEFGAGKIASAINKLLSGAGIPGGDKLSDILKQADKLLSCVSSICAIADPNYLTNVTFITNDLQSLFDDLHLIDNPLDPNYATFDYDTFYTDIGLTASQQTSMTKVITELDTQKDNSLTAVNNTVDAIKNYTKSLGVL